MKAAYVASIARFNKDVDDGTFIDLMTKGFREKIGGINKSEKRSWNANLPYIRKLTENLNPNAYIALETQDPKTNGRCDLAFFGVGENERQQLLVVELKQWSEAEFVDDHPSKVRANTHKNVVQETLHPCGQGINYRNRYRHWYSVCDPEEKGTIEINSCAYLYWLEDYGEKNLASKQYEAILKESPLYTSRNVNNLERRIQEITALGQGQEVFSRIHACEPRPNPRFAEQAVDVITSRSMFHFIDEQRIIYDDIRMGIKDAYLSGNRHVFVIEGGPGTGKTAIGLQLMAGAIEDGMDPIFVVKSGAMKTTIQKALGNDLQPFISYTDRFGYKSEKEHDLLIIDEAHRLSKISVYDWSTGRRRQKKREEMATALSQVEEIIRASKVSVFFIDESQIIMPEENTRIAAMKSIAHHCEATIHHHQLETQHRLSGSIEFMQWLDNTFSSPSPQIKEENIELGQFELEILDSPSELLEVHEERNRLRHNSSRLITSWCWLWAQTPNEDGTLIDEVIVLDENEKPILSVPWEAPKQWKRRGLSRDIASGEFWATHESGMQSFGTVYTAQGFDFPTVCMLWPRDLMWRDGKWVGNPLRNQTPARQRGGHPNYDSVDSSLSKLTSEEIVPYLLNVYRILMSRATVRMYLAFLDEETKNFFESHL